MSSLFLVRGACGAAMPGVLRDHLFCRFVIVCVPYAISYGSPRISPPPTMTQTVSHSLDLFAFHSFVTRIVTTNTTTTTIQYNDFDCHGWFDASSRGTHRTGTTKTSATSHRGTTPFGNRLAHSHDGRCHVGIAVCRGNHVYDVVSRLF